MWVWKMIKRTEQRVYHNLLLEIVSMIENHILGNLYNKHFRKSSEEKCMVFQSMVSSLIVRKDAIKILLNCSATVQSIFLPVPLFVSFIFFFYKAKETSAIL